MGRGLDKQFVHLDEQLQKLQVGKSGTDRVVEEQSLRIKQLNEFCEGLNDRHLDMVNNLDNVSKACYATDHAVKQFMRTYNGADNSRRAELKSIEDRISQHDNAISTFHKDFLKVDSGLSAAVGDIHKMMEVLNMQEARADKDKAVDEKEAELMKRHQEANKRIEDLLLKFQFINMTIKSTNERLVESEATISAYRSDFETEKTYVADLVQTQQRQLEQAKGELSRVEMSMVMLRDVVTGNDRAIPKLLAEQKQVREHSDRVEGELRKVEDELKVHVKSQLERHEIELRRSESDIRVVFKDIEASKESMKHLKGEMAATNLNLSKLGTRYDSVHNTVMGMSKGIADTSRHVAQGENGMLAMPTQGLRAVMLPELNRGFGDC